MDTRRYALYILTALFIVLTFSSLIYFRKEEYSLFALYEKIQYKESTAELDNSTNQEGLLRIYIDSKYDNLNYLSFRPKTESSFIDDKIEFRIKKQGSDWFYKQTLVNQFVDAGKLIKFDIPSQNDSKGVRYIAEIEFSGSISKRLLNTSKIKPTYIIGYKVSEDKINTPLLLVKFLNVKLKNIFSDRYFILNIFKNAVIVISISLIFIYKYKFKFKLRNTNNIKNLFYDSGRLLEQRKVLFIIFICVAILSLRKLIFSNFENIGHNWDWGFPGLQDIFKIIYIRSFFSWNDFNFGRELVLQSQIIVDLIASQISRLLSPKNTGIVIILIVQLSSFIFCKKLIDDVTEESTNFNYIPSLLFAFSPFLFNEIIGGSWYMWVAYGVTPVMISQFIAYVLEGKSNKLIGYLISSIFVIISLQNFVSAHIIILLYFVIYFLSNGIDIVKLFRYFAIHVAFIVISLYWIIPFIYQASSFYRMISSSVFSDGFSGVASSSHSIFNIFTLFGYLDRNMYISSVPKLYAQFIYLCISFFWLATMWLISRSKKENYYKDIIWIFILLITTLLVKGGNPPFGNISMFFYRAIPVMALYRSPQHLMIIPSIIIPVIMGLLMKQLRLKYKMMTPVNLIILLLVLVWSSGWWINGDIGKEVLSLKAKDHIDTYSLSPFIKNVYRDNLNSKLNFRYVGIPTVCSPTYIKNEFQSDSQGGQPELEYLPNPTICSEFNFIANEIDNYFCDETQVDIYKVFSLASIKYIALRSDINPKHTSCAVNKLWSFEKANEKIKQMKLLSAEFSSNGSTYFKIPDEMFVPILNIPPKIYLKDGDPRSITTIISNKNIEIGSAVFLPNNSQSNLKIVTQTIAGQNIFSNSFLEYRKINPTKYAIRFKLARGLVPLVFNTTYNQGWKLYLDKKNLITNTIDKSKTSLDTDSNSKRFISPKFFKSIQNDNLQSGPFYETWLGSPLSESSAAHLIVNGYANSWIIDIDSVCKNAVCIQNADGSYEVNLILEFYPQRLAVYGLISTIFVGIISVTTYLLLKLKIVIFNKNKKK